MNLPRMFSSKKTSKVIADTFEEEVIRAEAKYLLHELRCSPMRVILIPAPEQRHSGHMIRAVDSRPPDWYMELYRKRGRKTYKRHLLIDGLENISKGIKTKSSYQAEILTYIKRLIGD